MKPPAGPLWSYRRRRQTSQSITILAPTHSVKLVVNKNCGVTHSCRSWRRRSRPVCLDRHREPARRSSESRDWLATGTQDTQTLRIKHTSTAIQYSTRKWGKAQRVARPACTNTTVHFKITYRLAMQSASCNRLAP